MKRTGFESEAVVVDAVTQNAFVVFSLQALSPIAAAATAPARPTTSSCNASSAWPARSRGRSRCVAHIPMRAFHRRIGAATAVGADERNRSAQPQAAVRSGPGKHVAPRELILDGGHAPSPGPAQPLRRP